MLIAHNCNRRKYRQEYNSISQSDLVAIERGRALRQGPFCFLQLLYKGTKGSVGCRSPPSVLVCQQTKMEGHE